MGLLVPSQGRSPTNNKKVVHANEPSSIQTYTKRGRMSRTFWLRRHSWHYFYLSLKREQIDTSYSRSLRVLERSTENASGGRPTRTDEDGSLLPMNRQHRASRLG